MRPRASGEVGPTTSPARGREVHGVSPDEYEDISIASTIKQIDALDVTIKSKEWSLDITRVGLACAFVSAGLSVVVLAIQEAGK